MKKINIVSIAFITLLLFAAGASADFDSALAAYNRGEFADAYAEFQRLAESGNHGAQFNLGVMHCRGQYIPVDIPSCYGWMALASQAPFVVRKFANGTYSR